MSVNLVKKLSAKDLLGNIIDIVKGMEVGDVVEAYAVAGICSSYETGTSTYGTWYRFCGELQGINYLTGEVYRSGKVHVPDILETLILEGISENAVINSEKSTKTTTMYDFDTPIEFSFKVSVERLEPREDKPYGYKYHVRPLTEVAKNDRIQHLVALIEAPMVQTEETLIEAPKGAPKKSGKKA